MQITVFGRTDKRACIYTLMKILQPLGDVAVITNNRHFTRLTEDGGDFGFYQNISIFVTDVTTFIRVKYILQLTASVTTS